MNQKQRIIEEYKKEKQKELNNLISKIEERITKNVIIPFIRFCGGLFIVLGLFVANVRLLFLPIGINTLLVFCLIVCGIVLLTVEYKK